MHEKPRLSIADCKGRQRDPCPDTPARFLSEAFLPPHQLIVLLVEWAQMA